MALSSLSLLLGVQSFRVSEGVVELFEEDVNLGRLQKLRREIFPENPGDYDKAPVEGRRLLKVDLLREVMLELTLMNLMMNDPYL